MSSNIKIKWLEEGLAVLAESGGKALTIDALTTRLGLTKGSFYHHFQNWQDYKENLLSLFENQRTAHTIENAEKLTPADQFEYIMQTTLQRDQNLEVAIRAWGLLEPMVQSYQQRIDQNRIHFLEELMYTLCHERERALRMALVFYCLHVGSQHLAPPVQGQNLEDLYREVQTLFNIPRILRSDDE